MLYFSSNRPFIAKKKHWQNWKNVEQHKQKTMMLMKANNVDNNDYDVDDTLKKLYKIK